MKYVHGLCIYCIPRYINGSLVPLLPLRCDSIDIGDIYCYLDDKCIYLITFFSNFGVRDQDCPHWIESERVGDWILRVVLFCRRQGWILLGKWPIPDSILAPLTETLVWHSKKGAVKLVLLILSQIRVWSSVERFNGRAGLPLVFSVCWFDVSTVLTLYSTVMILKHPLHVCPNALSYWKYLNSPSNVLMLNKIILSNQLQSTFCYKCRYQI